MKKFVLLAALLMFSLGAFAQETEDHPGGPPDGAGKPAATPAQIAAAEVKFLTVLLDLTSTQQDKATQLFTAAENAKVTPEATIATQRANLAAAETHTPTGDLAAPIAAIATATSAILAADAGAEAAFYAYLVDPAQKAKYAAFLKGDFVVPGNGHGPGHGNGPGGGHPPSHGD